MKQPPPGFETIKDQLDRYEDAMKMALQGESLGVMGRTTVARHTKRPRTLEGDTEEVRLASDAGDEATDPGAPGDTTTAEHGEEEKAKDEAIPPLWRVASINHQRTRYVFNACFREREISKEVFDYCSEMQFIDGGLARRWRLPGYEQLCCTACGVPGSASVSAALTTKLAYRNKAESKKPLGSSSSKTATCICRVPASQRTSKTFHACVVCGCKGCCSADVGKGSTAGRDYRTE